MINTDLIKKVLDNRYELVDLIGEGGMACVFKAKDYRTGHDVAVKILKPEYNSDQEFIERFDREAAAASRMSHHNIVNLLDVGQSDSYRYIVMEYVRGKTLKEIIEDHGALSYDITAQIILRVLSALQHAHSNGIIHRDIKPQNILVHSDGHIKVADFGIARMAGTGTLSTTDRIMGSVYYFSPEQAKGLEVSTASDIYSVGVMMYEMLTGHVPFEGESQVSVALQQVNASPPPMSSFHVNVPSAIENIVLKAMSKAPEQRYQSALEMAQDIHRALHDPEGNWLEQDEPIPSLSASDGRPIQVKNNQKLWMKILLFSVCILLLCAAAYGVYRIYDQIVHAVEMPYVLDETEEEAKKICIREGLNVTISRANDDAKAAGTVIVQTPEYGAQLRKGDTVLLTVSLGPLEQPMIKIVGMQTGEAKEALQKIGATMFVLSEITISSQPVGTILSQNPAEGELISNGGIVQVTISGGSVELPDLAGYKKEEALQTLEKLGIQVTEIKEMATEDAALDSIVAGQQYYDRNLNPYQVGDTASQSGTKVVLAVYTSVEPSDEVEP